MKLKKKDDKHIILQRSNAGKEKEGVSVSFPFSS